MSEKIRPNDVDHTLCVWKPQLEISDWHAKTNWCTHIVHNAYARTPLARRFLFISLLESVVTYANFLCCLTLNLCWVCVCVAFISYLHCCEFTIPTHWPMRLPFAFTFAFALWNTINVLGVRRWKHFIWEIVWFYDWIMILCVCNIFEIGNVHGRSARVSN